MYKIINKQVLAQDVKRLDVEAVDIARKAQPGQFVMVTPQEDGEGIPLSVIEADSRRGTIVLIVQETNTVTRQLGSLRINNTIFSIVGPFGNATKAKASGLVICVATGTATAQILPICRSFKKEGNKVIGVIGAETKRSVMLEVPMRTACHRVLITTDDGSYERRGTAAECVKELLDNEDAALVYAIGTAAMMKDVCQMTAERRIPTRVQVNPVMFCGRGICGSCRCTVNGETVLSCIDGPEFDGHKVDFESLRMHDAPRREEVSSSGIIPTKVKVADPSFSKKQSLDESRRCPQCTDAPCVPACPLNVDILGFFRLLREGDAAAALDKIKEQNDMPGICGRLCPAPCEDICVLNEKGSPIGIKALERYAADHGEKISFFRKPLQPTGKRIAVIGSGPAGLTAAAQLAKKGYRVTIFESLPEPGGALRYGVSESRLPVSILDKQIDKIKSYGVEIKTNLHVGQVITLRGLLFKGFSSVLLTVGAGKPCFPDIPGSHLRGVYFAEEILMRTNFSRPNAAQKQAAITTRGKVAVIGKGRTALECATLRSRLGEDVSLIFDETEEDLDVSLEERELAKEAGVKFESLTRPVAFETQDNDFVCGVKCERVDFADPDLIGRWELIAVPDSEFVLAADTVIIAVGSEPNISSLKEKADLSINEDRTIWTDEDSGMTSLRLVFAAGGAVTRGDSLLDAMVSGKKAAGDIDRFLTQGITRPALEKATSS